MGLEERKNFAKFFRKTLDKHGLPVYNIFLSAAENAGVAQLVEQLICNQQVGGSSPSASSKRAWPVAADAAIG